MAYDSATATSLAANAYQRAVDKVNADRTSLNTGYGLTSEGLLDPTNRLGSIYQGDLASAHSEQSARMADQSRGFGAGGQGLAGKHQAEAHTGALDKQGSMFADAASQLAANRLQGDSAFGDYKDSLSTITSNKQADDAETLRQNQILSSLTPNSPTAPAGVGVPGNAPVQIKKGIATLKTPAKPVTFANAMKNAGW